MTLFTNEFEGLESVTKKDRTGLRYERNVKSENHHQTLCKLCHEWAKTIVTAQASVSLLLLNAISFLINMNYAFQDRENLYLVCDLMSGGDLRFHIGKKKRFTED